MVPPALAGADGPVAAVPRYSVGEAAAILGVSADTVRRWIDAGRLAAQRGPGGRRLVEGAALAALARASTGEGRRLALTPASARNRLPGLVTSVVADSVMAQVEMACGPYRVVSLMSREAADELGLAPGVPAVACVKATAVTVELPAGR